MTPEVDVQLTIVGLTDIIEQKNKLLNELNEEGLKLRTIIAQKDKEIDSEKFHLEACREALKEVMATVDKLQSKLAVAEDGFQKILEQPNETMSNSKAMRWMLKIAKEALIKIQGESK